MGEAVPQRGSTNPRGDEIGSRAHAQRNAEEPKLAVKKSHCNWSWGCYCDFWSILLALPGDLLFPGFRASQSLPHCVWTSSLKPLQLLSTSSRTGGLWKLGVRRIAGQRFTTLAKKCGSCMSPNCSLHSLSECIRFNVVRQRSSFDSQGSLKGLCEWTQEARLCRKRPWMKGMLSKASSVKQRKRAWQPTSQSYPKASGEVCDKLKRDAASRWGCSVVWPLQGKTRQIAVVELAEFSVGSMLVLKPWKTSTGVSWHHSLYSSLGLSTTLGLFHFPHIFLLSISLSLSLSASLVSSLVFPLSLSLSLPLPLFPLYFQCSSLTVWFPIVSSPFLSVSLSLYIYMLWCYYLGQVWPFEVLWSGPSLFFFTKHCLSKTL